MKRFSLFSIVALLLAATSAFAAPTAPTFTTTSAAQTQTATTLTLTSTTGITASTQAVPTYVLVESELEKVVTVNSSTSITVVRKQGTTAATPHASGVYAVYGQMKAGGASSWDPSQTGSPTFGVFMPPGVAPTGSCTLTSQQYSPVYGVGGSGAIVNGTNSLSAVYACNGGKWTSGAWPGNFNNPTVAAVRQCVIPIGALALTAYGTDTVDVAGTVYVASIDILNTRVVSTLSGLTGTTAPTTDKQLFSLYDAGGILIASSALAGLEAATADIFFDQAIALVHGAAGTKIVLAPGRYFLGNQLAGTTTSMQKIAIATGYQNLVGNSRTGAFGTLANITVPTSLTDVAAPIMCIS